MDAGRKLSMSQGAGARSGRVYFPQGTIDVRQKEVYHNLTLCADEMPPGMTVVVASEVGVWEVSPCTASFCATLAFHIDYQYQLHPLQILVQGPFLSWDQKQLIS
ncbi:hypothetical protein RRG08_021143 [Elysia crispata]|uniref:Uncharacterized protein n=1 Tax=Elysia crispata TaxID=231223 RepID=A0AAE1DB17_9GAST|nr:hypothetical protein RRG08_021143 [Elysia crispata]